MEYKIFEKDIEVLEDSWEQMTVFLNSINRTFEFSLADLELNEATLLKASTQEFADNVLMKMEYKEFVAYLYCLNNNVYLIKEKKFGLEQVEDVEQGYYPITFKAVSDKLEVRRTGILRFSVLLNNHLLVELNDRFFLEKYFTEKIPYTQNQSDLSGLLLIINYGNNVGYLTKNHNERFIQFSKVFFDVLEVAEDLEISLVDPVTIELCNRDNFKEVIDLAGLSPGKSRKICAKEKVSDYKKRNMLTVFVVNRTRYYLFLKQTGLFIQKGYPEKVSRFTQKLKSFSFGNNIYIVGSMLHRAYNSTGKYDFLYSGYSDEPIGRFFRPLKRIKFFKKFGFYKLNIKHLDFGTQVHYPVWIGNHNLKLHRLSINPSKKSWVYSLNRSKEKVYVLRSDIHGNVSYSIVPDNPMYDWKNRIKQKIAFYRATKEEKTKNINLFFEKMASKADESGFRVFEAVMSNAPYNDSDNYYILDESSSAYPIMKEKYGENIVERFSYLHYKLIFQSNYLVSSDLSNHVIADRIYINAINQKLKEVPLIFLQHGIMFAKPVENPMGKIFYKKYGAYNVYKNVINSQLEAFEFYKMGYDDFDLIKTGLATFDYAKLDITSDKIVYMPTYRYWEEGMIYSGDIEKTTYYKSLVRIIDLFEKAGLIHRLVLVSHNKFADYIVQAIPEYKELFAPNPSVALGIGRIFISDYSSAIYDAIYRGAYPIFYWEDKDYLIKNYKAQPPVNETNAPGVVVYSGEELMEKVLHAIERNYELEEENKKKYKRINEFHDNKNTERIIEYMKNDNIL